MIVDEELKAIYVGIYTLFVVGMVFFIPKNSKIKRLIVLLLIISDIGYVIYLFHSLSFNFISYLVGILFVLVMIIFLLIFLLFIIIFCYDYVMKGKIKNE